MNKKKAAVHLSIYQSIIRYQDHSLMIKLPKNNQVPQHPQGVEEWK